MKFWDRLKNSVSRMFNGCHGMDQLNAALFVLYLIIYFINACIKNTTVWTIVYVIRLAVLIILAFRIFSKNNGKRYAENARFLNWYNPIKNSIAAFFARIKDKDHRYFKCSCGTYLRVPKGKGKIKLHCSKCGKEMIRKS